MIISRRASRLAGHSGAVAPDASRHQLFTAGGQADSRRVPASMGGTAR
jgi:hypothetical protein